MSGRAHSRRAWVVAAAVAVAATVVPAPAARASITERIAKQVRECANSERAKHGLGHLAENPILDQAAAFHARNMAKYDFFDHDDPWGRTPEQRIDKFGSAAAFDGTGENIAAGETSAAQACEDWMNSPGHRANILDPTFHSVGGGFARGDTEYRFYYVQEFGEANPGGGPAPDRQARPARTTPPVVMRLFRAGDALTLSVDGRRTVTAHPGQNLHVQLGRLDPHARITVEARSASGQLSWGVEERSGGRPVYRDAHAADPEPDSATVDLASASAPLVHRVVLDPRGRVLDAFTSDEPPPERWRGGGPVTQFR
jgi:uncharacterized protein YkwD